MMDESAGALAAVASPPAQSASRGRGRSALAARVQLAVPFARILGTYGALAVALLYARGHIDQLLGALQKLSPLPAMRMDIVCWRTEPLTQSRSYTLVLAVVAAVAVAHALVLRLLRRWPLLVIALEALVLASAYALARGASPFLETVFFLGLIPAAAFFAPFVIRERRAPDVRWRRSTFLGTVALQAIPLAWGVWITTFQLPLGAILGFALGALALSLWRLAARSHHEDDAFAGLVFTPLPVVGLLRSPSWGWVVGAALAYLALRAAFRTRELGGLLRRARVRSADLVVTATLWSIAAVLTAPYRFRDLPRLNHLSHESGQYGSINSIAHGKLMMADAGLIYGPLRSYVLALYMRFAGMTAEQVRLGQALMTLVALGAIVALGWRLVERRPAAMGWFLYLLLVATLAMDWINYQGVIAFGWADFGRIAVPFFIAVKGIDAVLAHAREPGDPPGKRSVYALVGWGAGGIVATLWAQEFGACTIAALLGVPVVHALLLRGAPLARRRSLRSVVYLAAGLAAAGLLFLAVYAAFGRAGLFLKTVTAQSAAFASGSYGLLPFPANETTFLSFAKLLAPAGHEGYSLEYVLAPAVYLFTLVALAERGIAGRWAERDAVTLSILVFGMASFFFALGRSDYLHLVTTTLPATVLVVRLAVEGVSAVYASRAVTWTLRAGAAATAAGLAVASLGLTGIPLGLQPRLAGILAGTERPSSGPPYVYPGIPRAGDVKIQPEYVKLVEAIDANSAPNEMLFQHIGYMDGAEVYFLADRENVTRFDVLAEFLTEDRQREALAKLKANPPKLTAGEDIGMIGPEATQFLSEHYHPIGDFSGLKLFMRNE